MRRRPRRDLLAGLTVAVVALPLALGFGVSSGLGAEAGLATAVVAGALAAVFGGSNLQVSGPTGAMTVVLVPIVAQHGPGGVLTVGLMAGVILVALALLRAGGSMRYVPAPVVEGFTLGIACVIGLQQIPNALGVPEPEGERVLVVAWRAGQEFVRAPNWTALALAFGVAAMMLLGARWKPTIPFSVLAVIVATVVAQVAGLDGARPIGDLPPGLPAPSISFVDTAALGSLVAPALAVAALAALESLLSASVADGMTVGQRHDPDRELFGQGLANIAAPLFGGVPATGAIARTAVNVRSGATSRLASLMHAAVLAVIVFAAAPLVSRIPLAALAGVLLATAVRMVEVGSLRAMTRATRSDAVILVLTAAATLVLDLVQAVIIGLAVAGVLALGAVARQARLAPLPLDRGDHTEEEHELLAEHIVAYRIDGPLFFAAAHRFLLELTELADVRVVILRMSHVSVVDATGALVLKDAVTKLRRRGILVLASGIRPAHRRALASVGVLELLRDEGREYATTPEAIGAARAHLERSGVLRGAAVPRATVPTPHREAP
ncbi:SulP family inorganic anion transporter [Streptomyces sp. NPDC086080]|uniref:SulP family inorganic anion transporter n=1 Tax=Streptomyces sp. NPDC086080 TaxID=3365748 RepID=UPI0037D81B72